MSAGRISEPGQSDHARLESQDAPDVPDFCLISPISGKVVLLHALTEGLLEDDQETLGGLPPLTSFTMRAGSNDRGTF